MVTWGFTRRDIRERDLIVAETFGYVLDRLLGGVDE
jgi:hypothetical protein